MAYNPYQDLNQIAYYKNVWETGDEEDKSWASQQVQPHYQSLQQHGFSDLGQQLQNLGANEATQFADNFWGNQQREQRQGLMPLRNVLEGAGHNVNWNADTGVVTADGRYIDTSGMLLQDGTYYVDPNQLMALQDNLRPHRTGQEVESAIREPQQFDPSSDQSYQAYLSATDRAARSNFNRNLANIAARTGGRVSNAAIASAAQAANVAAQQGVEAMPAFEDRHRAEQQRQLQNLMGLYDMQQGAIDTDRRRGFEDTAEGRAAETHDLQTRMAQIGIDMAEIDLTNYPEQVRQAMAATEQAYRLGELREEEARYLLGELTNPNSVTNRLARLNLEQAIWEFENNQSLAPLQRQYLQAQIGNMQRQAAGIGISSGGTTGTGTAGTGAEAPKPTFTVAQIRSQAENMLKQLRNPQDPTSGNRHSKDDVINYVMNSRLSDQQVIDILNSVGITEADRQAYERRLTQQISNMDRYQGTGRLYDFVSGANR